MSDVNALTAQLFEFLCDHFDQNELEKLCYGTVGHEMMENWKATHAPKDKLVMELIGYCVRRGVLNNLLANVKKARPALYSQKGLPTTSVRPRDPQQVFISHSSKDAELAQRLADDLKYAGLSVWITPDSIRPLEDWEDAIFRGLDESGKFVLLMSPNAVRSKWVKNETKLAYRAEQEGLMAIYPLMIADCDPHQIFRLLDAQAISFKSDGYDEGLRQLLDKMGVENVPAKIAQLQAKIVALNALIDLLSVQNNQLQQTVNTLGQQLEATAIQNKLLIRQLEVANKSVSDLKVEIDSLIVKFNKHDQLLKLETAQKLDWQRKAQELTTQYGVSVAKAVALTTQLDEAQKRIIKLESDLDKTRRRSEASIGTGSDFGSVKITRRDLLIGGGGALSGVALSYLAALVPGGAGTGAKPTESPVATKTIVIPTVGPTMTPSPAIRRINANLVALKLAPNVELELVRVEAGEFIMGGTRSEDEKHPNPRQRLDEYWIGKTAVTVAQFAVFMAASKHKTQAEQDGQSYVYDGKSWGMIKGADWAHPRGPNSDVGNKQNHPVTCVSWQDAVAFCNWASKSTNLQVVLPSEAEWEKAARGVDGREYPWGNEVPSKDHCNFNMNVGDTTEVGRYSKFASSFGCQDMAGNVWDWTRSAYKGYKENQFNQTWILDIQNTDARVLRGGSFNYDDDGVRCAYRNCYSITPHYNDIGFRVCVPHLSTL